MSDDNKNPREAALELVKALRDELAPKELEKSEYDLRESLSELGALLKAELATYREMQKREVAALRKNLRKDATGGLPSGAPPPAKPPMKSVFDILKSNPGQATSPTVAPTMKTEDFIDTSNDNDKEKRLKTMGGKGTVLPLDKKPVRVGADGSGGEKSSGSVSTKVPKGKDVKITKDEENYQKVAAAKGGGAHSEHYQTAPPTKGGSKGTENYQATPPTKGNASKDEMYQKVAAAKGGGSHPEHYQTAAPTKGGSGGDENYQASAVKGEMTDGGVGARKEGKGSMPPGGTGALPTKAGSLPKGGATEPFKKGAMGMGIPKSPAGPTMPVAPKAPKASGAAPVGKAEGDGGISQAPEKVSQAPAPQPGVSAFVPPERTVQNAITRAGPVVPMNKGGNVGQNGGGDIAPLAMSAGPKLGGKDPASQAMTAHAFSAAKPTASLPKPPTTPPPTMEEHAARHNTYSAFMPKGSFGKKEFEAEKCPYCHKPLSKCTC